MNDPNIQTRLALAENIRKDPPLRASFIEEATP
jgi:hypothetical protein